MAKGDFILEFMANDLGKTLEGLSEELETSLRSQIKTVADAAYANIVAMVQANLHDTKSDYLSGLNFEQLDDDTYLISLVGDYANKLESGYPSFDMKAKMLQSEKIVQVGPRTGLPWVQEAKSDGHKFAHVPFEHKSASKAPAGKTMADAIKSIQAENALTGERQRITKIFRDAGGAAIDSGSGKMSRPVARASAQDLAHLSGDVGAKLMGLVKYQRVRLSPNGGKESVQSLLHTYRTVSENGSGWIHPGFEGLKAFPQTEQWVEAQLQAILKDILK